MAGIRVARSRVKGLVGWPALALVLSGTAACAHGSAAPISESVSFSHEVRRLLAADRASLEYYDARAQLEAMGPEVDAVLVSLSRDFRATPVARANALILLADRRSPAAIPVLRNVLLTEEVEMLRSAAVLGLQRLTTTSDSAAALIRSAINDPARTVRLNALQALDIRDVELIRHMVSMEEDPEVRTVAVQLVALAESRGAPLAPDRRGALRTAAMEGDPQIVFRPSQADSLAQFAYGDLRVELPDAEDVPLTAAAEVVGRVVPAFFSPDRSRVVYEAEREILLVDLATREVQSYGPGIAPRVVPFSDQFIFLRELPERRREVEDGTELHYTVFRASFTGGEAEVIGETTALAQMVVHANYSPVRKMVVGEIGDGFALRGHGMANFPLPAPSWRPAPRPAPRQDAQPTDSITPAPLSAIQTLEALR